MENQKKQHIKRRSVLSGILSLFVGTVVADPVVQTNTNSGKKAQAVVRSEDSGLTHIEVLYNTRLSLGLQNNLDITDETSDKVRIADSLTQGLSVNELAEQEHHIKSYASNAIFELMETKAYSAQSEIDMKFIYISANQEIGNAINSFKENLINLKSAQLEIRSIFGGFITNLEQIPADAS